ncbi:hypothetical protein C1752_01861 [Acaryochloris thomasi RCC1774]|uniref:Uncharacterized protein n=1 Tax=Acaryochloris thomasi RCC1774 TaxID=1764569 RepID=A0A2W1JKL7_9CYAN|nr:hypothetical protein [Acaryochloris thomasi]PZD73928.1 hypothetical protein C1752_01861 [Acaryochloris thomasi RCC1774]
MNRIGFGLLLSMLCVSYAAPVKSLEPRPAGVSKIETENGVVAYQFEPNSQQFPPKLHNWEVLLNKVDSQGRYEIVQITHSLTSGQTQANVLIPDDMVIPNADGYIHFDLHVGDTEPTQNANGTGNLGHSIIFSGNGTGTGASSSVILPGSSVRAATPSLQGASLSAGQLRLIRYVVTDAVGEDSVVEVVLRRQ